MNASRLRSGILCLAPLLLLGAGSTHGEQARVEEKTLTVQYLEIVTPSVDATCDALAKAHGVVFSAPVPEFGNARTADLEGGGRIGVRGPMRDTETPVVRP